MITATLLALALTLQALAPSPLLAASLPECEAYLCLPGGFPPSECNAAHAAVLRRLARLDPSLPPWSECVASFGYDSGTTEARDYWQEQCPNGGSPNAANPAATICSGTDAAGCSFSYTARQMVRVQVAVDGSTSFSPNQVLTHTVTPTGSKTTICPVVDTLFPVYNPSTTPPIPPVIVATCVGPDCPDDNGVPCVGPGCPVIEIDCVGPDCPDDNGGPCVGPGCPVIEIDCPGPNCPDDNGVPCLGPGCPVIEIDCVGPGCPDDNGVPCVGPGCPVIEIDCPGPNCPDNNNDDDDVCLNPPCDEDICLSPPCSENEQETCPTPCTDTSSWDCVDGCRIPDRDPVVLCDPRTDSTCVPTGPPAPTAGPGGFN